MHLHHLLYVAFMMSWVFMFLTKITTIDTLNHDYLLFASIYLINCPADIQGILKTRMHRLFAPTLLHPYGGQSMPLPDLCVFFMSNQPIGPQSQPTLICFESIPRKHAPILACIIYMSACNAMNIHKFTVGQFQMTLC